MRKKGFHQTNIFTKLEILTPKEMGLERFKDQWYIHLLPNAILFVLFVVQASIFNHTSRIVVGESIFETPQDVKKPKVKKREEK